MAYIRRCYTLRSPAFDAKLAVARFGYLLQLSDHIFFYSLQVKALSGTSRDVIFLFRHSSSLAFLPPSLLSVFSVWGQMGISLNQS
jgi:hypothetical protein